MSDVRQQSNFWDLTHKCPNEQGKDPLDLDIELCENCCPAESPLNRWPCLLTKGHKELHVCIDVSEAPWTDDESHWALEDDNE